MSYPTLYHQRLRLANFVERISCRLMAWLRKDEKQRGICVYNVGRKRWVLTNGNGTPIGHFETFESANAAMGYHSLGDSIGRKVNLDAHTG